MKKKILIYIDGDEYIRNYFSYDSFDLSKHEVVIYANKNICNKHIMLFNDRFRGYINDDPKRLVLRSWQCDMIMTRFIGKSKSFTFRFNRYGRSRREKLKILTLPFIFQIASYVLSLKLRNNKEIENVLLKEKPDLVIIPTQVASPMCLDFIDSCERYGIKTLCLIDGWDNISSKTIFPTFPSYMAVWGEQSIKHAVEIQKFPEERVYQIGTPRFESYNKMSNDKKPYDFKYIVFTGCSIAFDEVSALKILDYTLIQNGIKDIQIIYRPHPWRQKRSCFDCFIPEDFQNVQLDKQMVNFYQYSKTGDINVGIQPDLKYYPDLLNNCLFTISPLTTMIMEAAIVGKYVMVLAYDDGIHYTNPKNALNNYEHFEGVKDISAFKFCYKYEDLSNKLLEMLKLVGSEPKYNDFKDEIKYIIDQTGEKYSNKLNNIVEDIFKKVSVS